MRHRRHLSVAEARSLLPSLIDAAEHGRTTVITRHGKRVVAVVPLETQAPLRSQQALMPLHGSGAGMWGADGRDTLHRLWKEWHR